jgi:hypothetical protein
MVWLGSRAATSSAASPSRRPSGPRAGAGRTIRPGSRWVSTGSPFPVNIPTLRTSVYRACRPAKAASTNSSIAAVELNSRSKRRVQAGSSALN